MSITTHITTERGPSNTRYTITGDRVEVERAISKLTQEYHPYGYGTQVDSMTDYPGLPGEFGYTRAIVTRRNSCD